MLVYSVSYAEHTKEEIFNSRFFNVYVIGLPRSGTSMMTNCVRLLGVNILATSEDSSVREERDKIYKNQFGDYHPNENGFYEITKQIAENFLDLFSVPYSGCKMIMPVSGFRLDLLKTTPSRVIFMTRNPNEIKASQEAFYSKKTDLAYLRSILIKQPELLTEAGVPFLTVKYGEVLKDPTTEITRIAKFINAPNSIDEAINSINPKMHRFKCQN